VWEPNDCDNTAIYGKLSAVATHFAHLSLKTPGQIAYTPTDEHGYQDKQTTIKTGRYLEKYLADVFTAEERAVFIDKVKAVSGDLQITREARAIEAIYTNNHDGMRSCMSRSKDRYLSPFHPSRAYADSPDLAVAYLGTLDHPTARCIVWPERKLWTRVYGDNTLAEILKAHGYTKPDSHEHGSLDGARIKAHEVEPNVYVMPYVDSASSASLSDCGEYLILHRGTRGRYQTHVTRESCGDTLPTGLTREEDSDECEDDDRHECGNCSTMIDDDEQYCSSCEDDRQYCESCNEDYFDGTAFHEDGNRWICESCYENACSTCEECSETWIERNLPRHDRLDSRDELASYCSDCRQSRAVCEDCSDVFDTSDCNDPASERCNDCYTDPEDEDTPIKATDDQETQPLPYEATDPSRDPVISSSLLVRSNHDTFLSVEIIRQIGAFAVHLSVSTYHGNPRYTVTHIQSGLSTLRAHTEEDAIMFAEELAQPGIDWTGKCADDLCAEAKARYLYVRELARDTYHTFESPIRDSHTVVTL